MARPVFTFLILAILIACNVIKHRKQTIVYAQDMFTVFEENGLTDTETGKQYRQLILANGTQRDIEEAVEEFLGRPSNNEAYIRSLGLN